MMASERYIRERGRQANARSGAIPDKLWADPMLCLHSDRSASDAVLARTFDEMRRVFGVRTGVTDLGC
jgi:hypothetical protein